MSIETSDGLSLFIGDGEVEENFYPLLGMTRCRLDLTQQLNESKAVSANAWRVGVDVSARRAALECDMLGSDDESLLRLRCLAINNEAGTVRLMVSQDEVMQFQVFVTNYREIIQAGQLKRVSCKLESTGAIVIA